MNCQSTCFRNFEMSVANVFNDGDAVSRCGLSLAINCRLVASCDCTCLRYHRWSFKEVVSQISFSLGISFKAENIVLSYYTYVLLEILYLYRLPSFLMAFTLTFDLLLKSLNHVHFHFVLVVSVTWRFMWYYIIYLVILILTLIVRPAITKDYNESHKSIPVLQTKQAF